MPESTKKAIEMARNNGHKAIICTGRNMGSIRPLLKYGFDGIIASAGGYIQIGDKVLMDLSIPEKEYAEAAQVLRENGICITSETFDLMYIDEHVYDVLEKLSERNGNSELVRLRKQSDQQLHCRTLSEYKGEPVYKILLLAENHEQFTIPEQKLSDRYFFLKHPADENGIINGELINRKVGKGKALKIVTEYFGKDISDTIGFGDSMNDYEMVSAAGYSVCMGNGPEQLKQMTDYVCPDQKEDGLYQAFQILQLI